MHPVGGVGAADHDASVAVAFLDRTGEANVAGVVPGVRRWGELVRCLAMLRAVALFGQHTANSTVPADARLQRHPWLTFRDRP